MAEPIERPSTNIACGTYAIRPASRKKRTNATEIAVTVATLKTRPVSHGEICDPRATAKRTTNQRIEKPIDPTLAESASHNATRTLAPSSPQNLDFTAR